MLFPPFPNYFYYIVKMLRNKEFWRSFIYSFPFLIAYLCTICLSALTNYSYLSLSPY
jgi:hypothetical protein